MGWLFKAIASFSACTGCLLLLRAARADAPAPPPFLAAQENESGQHCTLQAEYWKDDKLLLACGAAGVWEFAVGPAAPRFVRSYAFEGDAVGFIVESEGRLWVKLQVLQARPFPTTAAAQSSAPAQSSAVFPNVVPQAPLPAPPPLVAKPAPPAATRPISGRVLRTAPSEVVIALGTSDGITPGDHIEFAPTNGDDDDDDVSLSREVLAVGVVTNVSAHNARVRLGLNERVPEAAWAKPTSAPSTSSLTAPPRVHGLWELELSLRPFAALEELGGGALLSGSIGYRFTHLHLQAVIDPLGFAAIQDKGDVATANAALTASYDSQYFEIGAGLGAQTVNEAGFALSPGSGLSVVQLIRLGARDGLSLSARTSVVLFHSRFQFGGMVASGQIPVTRGYWLLLNGGGGNVGYGFGELGLRVQLAGNGFAGSKYLTVSAGGVGIFRSAKCDEFFFCSDSRSYGGPMVGIGGEWRF